MDNNIEKSKMYSLKKIGYEYELILTWAQIILC